MIGALLCALRLHDDVVVSWTGVRSFKRGHSAHVKCKRCGRKTKKWVEE